MMTNAELAGLAMIFLVLFVPLRGGALVLILAFGLTFVLTSVEDRSNRLIAGAMVSGDVEQVAGATGLQASKLMDQGLSSCPREE